MRLNRSRPSSSVPKTCWELGARKRLETSTTCGSYEVRSGAAMEHATSTTITANPAAVSGLRSRRPASAAPPARWRIPASSARSRSDSSSILIVMRSAVPFTLASYRYPGVEQRIGQVDEQIDDHIDGGNQHG